MSMPVLPLAAIARHNKKAEKRKKRRNEIRKMKKAGTYKKLRWSK